MKILQLIITSFILVVIAKDITKDEPKKQTLIFPALYKRTVTWLANSEDVLKNTPLIPARQPSQHPPLHADTLASLNKPWPNQPTLKRSDELRIHILAEKPNQKHWAYRSKNFQFISNAPLRSHVIRQFAAQFELTHQYCSTLPLGLTRTQDPSQKDLPIYLIEKMEHYIARGGLPKSHGVYLSEQDAILVPFKGIGLFERNGEYVIDPDRTTQVLAHEVTHMLMRGPLLQSGWFVEGSAEYVSTIPITNNRLLPSHHLSSIKSYITGYGYKGRGGHRLTNRILLPPLKTLMECDYKEFQRMDTSYPYSLLVFYYFAHMDRKGDAAGLKAYAQSLHHNQEESTARKHLLAGRDYRTLQKLLKGSWQKHGITLSFDN